MREAPKGTDKEMATKSNVQKSVVASIGQQIQKKRTLHEVKNSSHGMMQISKHRKLNDFNHKQIGTQSL